MDPKPLEGLPKLLDTPKVLRPLLPVLPKFCVGVGFPVDPNGDAEPNVDGAALFVIVLPMAFTFELNGAAGVDAWEPKHPNGGIGVVDG